MSHADSAGRKAHEVVGLYGDPETTWGIGLELGLERSLAPADVADRLAGLVAAHPHLGPAPTVTFVDVADWARARADAAGAAYAHDGPLLRVLLGEGRVLVAAHHGACDGLGLVAVAATAADLRVVPRARGIGAKSAGYSFVRGTLKRLTEAIAQPPPRFLPLGPVGGGGGGDGGDGGDGGGEHLLVRTGDRLASGTADLAGAVADVFAGWRPTSPAGQPLLIAGASRRAPGTLAPDRQTGYLRFRVDPSWNHAQRRDALAAIDPEPDFPETSAGGLGPWVTRILRNRLGGTAQLSNLGVLDGAGIVYAAMFPALSGPHAVAVGMATTAASTTLSLRTRSSEFSPADTAELLDRIDTALRAAQ